MNKTLRSVLVAALFAGVSASGLQAATDYYRLSWRADPATTMVVGWRQSGGTNATVHYGTTDHGTNYASYPNSLGVSRTTTAKGMTHQFSRLTGLQPDTAYYFVVRDSQGTSPRMWFRTAPSTAKDFSVVAGGDSRNNRTPRQNANRMVSKLRPLFVMFGGDYTDANTNAEWSDWMADWQLTKSADGRMYPIVATRGNHDDNLSLVDMFDIPSSNLYYALQFGGSSYLRVYTLNSEITPGGTQGTWLTNDLAANAGVKWKLAQFHKPMFPHVSSKSENTAIYSAWAQAFYDRGVSLVVDSDSHTVKHTWPVRPTGNTSAASAFTRDDAAGAVYVGEGTWGAPLRTANDAKSYTRDMAAFNGFHWIQVRSDRLEVRTVKVDNATSVGSVSDGAPFTAPSGLDVWSPANGAVITITPRAASTTPPPPAGTTVSFQQGASGYTGASDTKIRSDASTTNYGSATTLEIDGSPDYAALLRFDLSSIPAGATITSVSLSLNVTNISSQPYEIYAMRRSWSESSATWNQASSGVNWSTAGANSTSTDRESTVLGAVSSSTTGVKTFAFNSAGVAKVQAWVNTPSSNHGFVIQDYVNNSDGLDFSSKENSNVSLRPKLIVTYEVAATTVSFQQGASGYTGASDTKIRSDATTTNYGSATALEIDGSPDYAALFRFDLSSIPAGKTITSVSLSLNVTNISSQPYEIYAMRRTWTESAATWIKATSTTNWSTAGANSTSSDRESTVLGTVSSSTTGVKTFPFNSAGVAKVQAWVNTPSSNHGFVIQDYVNNSDGLDVSSKETSTVSSRPKLTVTYQ